MKLIMPCGDAGGYRAFGWKYEDKNGYLLHTGYDFNVPFQTPIRAIADGITILSDEINGFGAMNKKGGVIIIQHEYNGEKFLALYGHLNRLKGIDIKVKQGDIIGTIIVYTQPTFRADHLHFSIIPGTKIPEGGWGYRKEINDFVDPIKFIKDRMK